MLNILTRCFCVPLKRLTYKNIGSKGRANSRSEYGCVLVNAQSSQVVRGCLDRLHALIHAYIPKFDLTTATPTYEFALTATLQMDVGDPLSVLFPHFHHGSSRFLPLVIDSDSAITKTSNKNITFYLIRRQGSDARTRPCR